MVSTVTIQAGAQPSEWFASWFDSCHYHKLYAHRDDAEAARFLDPLIARLSPRQGARVLDLGCGAGRHSRHLAAKGLSVTGLDLSADSIREARKRARQNLRFRRHDMRMPFGRRAFDYVFNLFTSFGYFAEPEEHHTVVRNMASALDSNGRLVLDYLNVRQAEACLRAEEVREIDGVVYRMRRWSDARHFFKRIVIDEGAGAPLEYVERVAKFTLQDFDRLFAGHGLAIDEVYGDYRLTPYDAATSPRLILLARRAGPRPEDYRRERLLRTRLIVSGDTPRYDASIH